MTAPDRRFRHRRRNAGTTRVEGTFGDPPADTPVEALPLAAAVEDPPGSGLYANPFLEDPPGSGLYLARLIEDPPGSGLYPCPPQAL